MPNELLLCGRRIIVEAAPDPADILWENLEVGAAIDDIGL